MKVRIRILTGTQHEDLEYPNVLRAGPDGNGQYFGVVQDVKEEQTPGGLIARVSGGKRHTFIPTRRVESATVEE